MFTFTVNPFVALLVLLCIGSTGTCVFLYQWTEKQKLCYGILTILCFALTMVIAGSLGHIQSEEKAIEARSFLNDSWYQLYTEINNLNQRELRWVLVGKFSEEYNPELPTLSLKGAQLILGSLYSGADRKSAAELLKPHLIFSAQNNKSPEIQTLSAN